MRFTYRQSVSPKQGQIKEAETDDSQGLQPQRDVDCKLLLKTPAYFFLNKGSAVHSVALDESETNSVANWLLSLDENQRDVSSPLESGLLHRLDFETSGVMVAARQPKAYAWLRKQFKEKKVYKEYVCLTEKPLKKTGWEKAWIQNHPRSKKRVVVTKDKRSGKQTEVSLKILDQKKRRKGYCLRIQLITGYRHQIRAQLAFLGCPIVGDSVYGGVPFSRLMLHASEIKFVDEQGKNFSVKCDYEWK